MKRDSKNSPFAHAKNQIYKSHRINSVTDKNKTPKPLFKFQEQPYTDIMAGESVNPKKVGLTSGRTASGSTVRRSYHGSTHKQVRHSKINY